MSALKSGVRNAALLLALLLLLILLYGSWYNQYKGRNDCSQVYPDWPTGAPGLSSRLPPLSCRVETLSRLGSELNFDASTCPRNTRATELRDSAAAASEEFSPQHNDCPSLYIVGARKGGSTSLIHYVSKHPDFTGAVLNRAAQAGETFYFDHYYELGMSWRAYMHLFPSCVVVTGESSVSYLVDCQVPRRVFQSCGNSTKVVMLLRDPVQRFFSDFQMRLSGLDINLMAVTKHISSNTHFNNVVDSEISGFTNNLPETFQNSSTTPDANTSVLHGNWSDLLCKFNPATSMINEGLYYIHLMNWLCNFPPENILVLNSEEFFSNTSILLKQVLDFIGLRDLKESVYDEITSQKYNSRKGAELPAYQTLSASEIEKLTAVFNPYNKALYSLLGWSKFATKWN